MCESCAFSDQMFEKCIQNEKRSSLKESYIVGGVPNGGQPCNHDTPSSFGGFSRRYHHEFTPIPSRIHAITNSRHHLSAVFHADTITNSRLSVVFFEGACFKNEIGGQFEGYKESLHARSPICELRLHHPYLS